MPILRRACAGKLPLARVVTNGHGGTPSRTHLLTVLVALQKRLWLAKLWSFQSLRHYFCSTLVRRGVSVAAVQALAGHENIRATDRYTHATREDLRAGISVSGSSPGDDPAVRSRDGRGPALRDEAALRLTPGATALGHWWATDPWSPAFVPFFSAYS